MAQLTHNLDDVAKAIAKDLRVAGKDFIPKATETAKFRASRSALSKWVSASAKAAKVPAKTIRGRSKNSKSKTGGRLLRIGTLNVKAGSLSPKKLARGGYSLRGHGKYPKAFRVQAKRGGSFLTQREGASRYPIKSITVPVEQFVRRNARVATDRMDEQFPKEFKRAIGVGLRKLERQRAAQTRRSLQRLRSV